MSEINTTNDSASTQIAAGLERLRASKAEYEERQADEERAEGRELGKKWALNHAEYDELKRVAALLESVESGGQWQAPGLYVWLAEAVDENQHRDEVIEQLFGDKPHHELTDDLLEGFIEGAAEVFDEV